MFVRRTYDYRLEFYPAIPRTAQRPSLRKCFVAFVPSLLQTRFTWKRIVLMELLYDISLPAGFVLTRIFQLSGASSIHLTSDRIFVAQPTVASIYNGSEYDLHRIW